MCSWHPVTPPRVIPRDPTAPFPRTPTVADLVKVAAEGASVDGHTLGRQHAAAQQLQQGRHVTAGA